MLGVPRVWQFLSVCRLQVVGALSLPGCNPVRSFPIGAKFFLGGVPSGAHDPSKNKVSNLEVSKGTSKTEKHKIKKKKRMVYRNPTNPMLTSYSPYLEKKNYIYISLDMVFIFLFSPFIITRVYILYKS